MGTEKSKFLWKQIKWFQAGLTEDESNRGWGSEWLAEATLQRVLDTFLKFRFYLVGTGKVLKDFKEVTSALRIGGKKTTPTFWKMAWRFWLEEGRGTCSNRLQKFGKLERMSVIMKHYHKPRLTPTSFLTSRSKKRNFHVIWTTYWFFLKTFALSCSCRKQKIDKHCSIIKTQSIATSNWFNLP